jgi:hypothetical protein
MKKVIFLAFAAGCTTGAKAQKLPCSNPVYRQFDFWIGE